MNLTFHVNDTNAQKFIASLDAGGRSMLFSVAARALAAQVRAWLSSAAATRHSTAMRLGAAPTAHWEDAAAAISPSSDGASGQVNIPVKGITRAFHPLDIYPKNKKALTIPIAAPSYGKTFGQLQAQGWTLFRNKKAPGVIYGKGHDDKVSALFLLRRHAHIPQDSGLLPSDAAMSKECAGAISSLLNRRMSNG